MARRRDLKRGCWRVRGFDWCGRVTYHDRTYSEAGARQRFVLQDRNAFCVLVLEWRRPGTGRYQVVEKRVGQFEA